ncbi:hypothetical protein HY628_01215 [Candidatus Uhrbacteria bacterium]|nr:hypothetical protein [Candidatus Uhrbacteria bacterium]
MKTVREPSEVGLEHLFGSKTRVKLLSLFLHNSDQSFYVRELVRRIGAQIHSVRRELANLCKMGIICSRGGSREKGISSALRKKYFQAERSFVLYDELQSLLRKAQVLVERHLVERVSGLGDVRYLVLCGKFLGEKSPIDLLVVGRVSAASLQRLLKRFEQEIGFELNYTLMSSDEFAYRRDITDRFLYSILEGKKMVMINRFPWNI